MLEEIGYNKDKLPLGKLSKTTLKAGFEQLRELASLVKHPSLAKNKYNRDRKEVDVLPIPLKTDIADRLRSSKSGLISTIQPYPTCLAAIGLP